MDQIKAWSGGYIDIDIELDDCDREDEDPNEEKQQPPLMGGAARPVVGLSGANDTLADAIEDWGTTFDSVGSTRCGHSAKRDASSGVADHRPCQSYRASRGSKGRAMRPIRLMLARVCFCVSSKMAMLEQWLAIF